MRTDNFTSHVQKAIWQQVFKSLTVPLFNLAIPFLAIKPKEIIKNVYKDFAEMTFIRVSFINVPTHCPFSLSAFRGGRVGDWRLGS